MGTVFSCVNEIPSLQRLEYDMTPIKSLSLPIIWLVGPPGAGRNIQARLLSDNLQFENIRVADLLREEAKTDTDRGMIIKEGLRFRNKKIPDTVVTDLIKEEMLKKCKNAKGFIINNFPRNSKQAALFAKEIGEADVIIYLSADAPILVKRLQQKNDNKTDDETIRRVIQNYIKEVKEGVGKFGDKLEKVYTNDPPENVYSKIEEVVNSRVTMKSKITAESDYSQSHENE